MTCNRTWKVSSQQPKQKRLQEGHLHSYNPFLACVSL